MKKILLLLVLVFGLQTTNAQYVTIPDSNFRKALKILYPGCFDANNKMDTTCSAVLNETSLEVGLNHIVSLEGLQYFKNLTGLGCDGNQLSTLPPLPPRLQYLACYDNALTSLPLLPNSLVGLYCFSNQLTSLPELSDNLGELYCYNNLLMTLPALPNNLYELTCYNNRLTSLPPLSSTRLQTFSCDNNQLTTLPAIPTTLQHLTVRNNPLSCLPPLIMINPGYVSIKGTNILCLPTTSGIIFDTIFPTCTNAADICAVNPFIQGKIYNDANNNNAFDSTEQSISQQIIKVLPNNWLGASDVNGNYIIKLDTVISNTWSSINNYRYATITPISYSLANIHSLGLVNGNYDFGIHLIPNVKDMETTLGASPARPGFATSISVTANNVGTVNQSGITIKLKKPNTFGVVSTSITPTTTINDTLIWNNISINYLQHQSINVQLQVPVNAVLGDSAIYEAWANSTQGDTTPLDNYTKWTEVIRGSFDPNDKLVNKATLPPTYNANKDRLLYTIRFQNTGTDTAFTVIVRDVVLNNIDVSSLRVVNASHKYQLIVREKNIVEVAFPNIQLPDSNTNEAKSHGFVQLEFKPKAGLPVNAEINNNASIFFDYNAPIVTNTATTKIQITTSIANNKKLAFKLFPNPATSIITVELPFEGNGKWYLMDISGKSIQQNTIENNLRTFDINVNNVSSGTYLLTLEINGIISTSKVAILK